MTPSNVYIRNTINLDQALIQKLVDRTLAGETIYLFARELKVAENISIDSRTLMLIADMFDGRAGQITSTVPNATTTPGFPAQAGQPGKPVAIICHTLRGANVVSRGGNGQPGIDGEPGQDGVDFEPPPSLFIQGTPGKDGKDGKRGGAGGAGGAIVLNYVIDDVPGGAAVSLRREGGKGGAGGKGGLKNAAGDHWPDGNPGQKGPNGAVGASGPGAIDQISEELYWSRANFAFEDWPKHRLRMAEYFFRRYRPNSADSLYRKLALDEANAVTQLALLGSPELGQAHTLRSTIESNMSPIGVERDIEPVLSVPYYLGDYALARQRADKIIDRSLLFGMTSVTVQNIRNLIEVFDPVQRTFTLIGIPIGPTRSQPSDLAFDPDGRLYVSNLGNTPAGNVAPNVTVVDLTADDATAVPTTSGPWTIALDPERNQAYAPAREGLELIAHSNHGGAPYSVMLRLAMGHFPVSVAVHPVSGEVYIGDLLDGSVHAAPAVDANQTVVGH